MSMLALDWNATRARGVLGSAGDYPLPVPLAPPALDLPMLISLERNTPDLGPAAMKICRQAPHLVCQRFLPYVGHEHGPRWQGKRQPFDANQAAQLVWQRLQPLGKSSKGLLLALPGYLSRVQADHLRGMGEKLKLPVLGSVPTPLVAALAAFHEHFWSRSVLVVDLDEHALTIALVKAVDDQAHVIETRSFPALGMHVWKDRLLNAVADLCVWQTRRDPRDAPAAEQSLYEQLDTLFDAATQQQAMQVGIQGQSWLHHVLIAPEQTLGVCHPLSQSAMFEAHQLVTATMLDDAPGGIVLTHAASRLPGLLDALRSLASSWPKPGETHVDGKRHTAIEDFGEDLFFDVASEAAGVMTLAPDAPARALHALASHFLRGELARGHHGYVAPLPLPQPVESGPARLHFQGQDHFLREQQPFALGSQYGSQLAFDPRQHPAVTGRHCEIVFEHGRFMLFNRCRAGTFVNDHPVDGSTTLRAGDWIRLGTHGPTVRFLGQALPRSAQLPAFA